MTTTTRQLILKVTLAFVVGMAIWCLTQLVHAQPSVFAPPTPGTGATTSVINNFITDQYFSQIYVQTNFVNYIDSTNTFITINQNLVIKSGKTVSGNLGGGTNLPVVSSTDIPNGAWFTNNVGDGASVSAASSASVTNAGDGWIFASGANTNSIRTRFSLPWDWDASTVKVGLFCLSSGTNNAAAAKTNVVWSVRAAAVGAADRVDSLSFGTAQRVTNSVNAFPYEQGLEGITAALTVGNSPSVAKGIVWDIRREASDAGDTETNTLYLAQVRIYYKRNTRLDYPTSSP